MISSFLSPMVWNQIKGFVWIVLRVKSFLKFIYIFEISLRNHRPLMPLVIKLCIVGNEILSFIFLALVKSYLNWCSMCLILIIFEIFQSFHIIMVTLKARNRFPCFCILQKHTLQLQQLHICGVCFPTVQMQPSEHWRPFDSAHWSCSNMGLKGSCFRVRFHELKLLGHFAL